MASFSELLGRRYNDKLDTDANDFISYIVDGAKRMQRLIQDLLAYSRVGRTEMTIGEIDSNSILERVINSMMPATEKIKAVITHDELPTLTGSESNFIQLFQNLIGNALKFHGSDLPRVHVSAEKQHGDWVFSVKDNGIGIEPQYKDRIFLIFQRLHEREKYPGTGMGLSICKKIVETQGGRIWVESEHGKGSIFYFSIPVKGGVKNE
jgi:Bacteriophytochrome (light-regulated signal transduction histidine kinase)